MARLYCLRGADRLVHASKPRPRNKNQPTASVRCRIGGGAKGGATVTLISIFSPLLFASLSRVCTLRVVCSAESVHDWHTTHTHISAAAVKRVSQKLMGGDKCQQLHYKTLHTLSSSSPLLMSDLPLPVPHHALLLLHRLFSSRWCMGVSVYVCVCVCVCVCVRARSISSITYFSRYNLTGNMQTVHLFRTKVRV